MPPAQHLIFGRFRLDVDTERVWRETQALPFRPKTFAVLRYLVEHPSRLVAKDELLDALWPGVYVSDAVLRVCIREIREALDDDPQTPQFIETVHGRGFRFIAPVAASAAPVSSSKFQVSSSDTQHSALSTQYSALVGREIELTQLHKWLKKALHGERQIVFVTGEAGIGKTTLVEAFLAQVAAEKNVRIGRGQCIEHFGAGEPYLPVLEALGRLCRESEGERVVAVLRQYAPTWLAQLPGLLSVSEVESLQRQNAGATRVRMLREMAEAMEVLTADKPVVLYWEDLHWSDVSSLDLLASLARRHERARLFVIGAYRPVEVLGNGHPLRTVTQELQLHHYCEELRVPFLTEGQVADYLTRRLAGETRDQDSPQRAARLIHRRTEGNPLFMVNVIDDLLSHGGLSVDGIEVLRVPRTLRQMIERQVDCLSPEEQQTLEVASVVGAEFAAAAVAAGMGVEVSESERRCAGLARRERFLQASGVSEWPDGTASARYGFRHALYQEVLYERVTLARRIELHRRVGERIEAAYGEQRREVAAELAMHFERGRDYVKAVKYLWQAGDNAVQRSAHQEAISLLDKALELLKTLPDSLARSRQELMLQITRGSPLQVTKGYSAPEVEHAYTRARELCQQVGEPPQLSPVLWGLWAFYLVRGELQTAHELATQLLRLARRVQHSELFLEAHFALGLTWLSLGELTRAREYWEQGIALYDPQQYRSHAFLYGQDPGVVCLSWMALVLWYLGYPDQALQRSQQAVTLARELSHPYSLAYALDHVAWLHQCRREGRAAQEWAQAEITFSTKHGFAFFLAVGSIYRGWSLIEQGQGEEGIAQVCQGLAAYQATGAVILQPVYLAWLAEAYGKVGQIGEGLTALAEALAVVDKTEERLYEAELYRLQRFAFV